MKIDLVLAVGGQTVKDVIAEVIDFIAELELSDLVTEGV